ncbi:MAG TPA: Uma2 family endonuclease [Acidimicrobiales bacterium]|nr:Uma2 family endonuclease [Acidimicrobiales bacterium]
MQLVDGAVVVDAPAAAHRAVAGNIFAKLAVFTGGQAERGVAGLALDVTVNPGNVYAPDVWWAREGRPDAAAGRLDAVPDLAVEVRSPATWRYDSGPKRRHYGEAGTAELWLVDPQARRIVVYRRSSTGPCLPGGGGFADSFTVTVGELLLSPLLPGFSLDLDQIFTA